MTKTFLNGATFRAIRMDSESPITSVIVTFATGQELPAGDLYATAVSGEDIVELVIEDVTGSDGLVTVAIDLDPVDFEDYGRRRWELEAGTFDGGSGSGSGDDVAHVMFSGSLTFRVTTPVVISSTTIEEAGS